MEARRSRPGGQEYVAHPPLATEVDDRLGFQMAIRIYTVTWHLCTESGVARTTAIAAERTLSEQELTTEVAKRHGLAVAEAIAVDTVVLT